jgi:hypothetical protein
MRRAKLRPPGKQGMSWLAECQQCCHQWALVHPRISRPLTLPEAFDAMSLGVCPECGYGHIGVAKHVPSEKKPA